MKAMFWPKLLAWLLAALLLSAVAAWLVLLRPVAQPHTNDPLAIFNHGSIGNEDAQGIPYWIWRVLPQVFPGYLPGSQAGYGAFGQYWVSGEPLPVGFSQQTLGVIPRVSINCAFCHQGSYRLYPNQPATLVPAGAGTRVRPQSYIRFLAKAGADARFNADRLMDEIKSIYAMPWWERLLYRYLLIPLTKKALVEQGQRFAWMDMRPDWGIGRIDPFNPVKYHELRLADDGTIGNSDIMPLWGLNQEMRDGSRAYAFHWDGLNESLHEVAVSGAIGDGTSYQGYARAKRHLDTIEQWIRLQPAPVSPFSSHLDPQDPYYVAPVAVEIGKTLFQAHCAECHSPTGPRFRKSIPAYELGTDRHRLDMWTDAARDAYATYQDGYDWGFKAFRNQDGYVATELTGLWLKGPYLHNGSVPTLRDLLLPATKRPRRFYRGSDLIDPLNGGFVSTGPEAEHFGWRYDVSVPGNGNSGHKYGTDLSAPEQASLLAYLKTL